MGVGWFVVEVKPLGEILDKEVLPQSHEGDVNLEVEVVVCRIVKSPKDIHAVSVGDLVAAAPASRYRIVVALIGNLPLHQLMRR